MPIETRVQFMTEIPGKPSPVSVQAERGFKPPIVESERRIVDPRTQVVNALSETINLISQPGSGKAAVESVLKDPAFKNRKSGELKSYRVNKFGDGRFRANEGIALNEVIAAAKNQMVILSESERVRLSKNLEILTENSKKYLDRGKRNNPEQYNARIRQEADNRGISFDDARKLIDERIELVMPTSRSKSAKTTTEKRRAGASAASKGDTDVSNPDRSGAEHTGANHGFEGGRRRADRQTPANTNVRRNWAANSGSDSERVRTSQQSETVRETPPRERFRDRLKKFKAKRFEARSNRISKRNKRIAGAVTALTLGTPIAASTAAYLSSESGKIPTTVVKIVSASQDQLVNIFDTPIRVGDIDYRVSSRQARQTSVETVKKVSVERSQEAVVWESQSDSSSTTTDIARSKSASSGINNKSIPDAQNPIVEDNAATATVLETVSKRQRGVPTARNNSADQNTTTTTAAAGQSETITKPPVATTIPPAPPVVEQVAPEPAPEPEPEPSTEAGKLAKQILNHPNISFDMSYPRILRSVQEIVPDGRTFLYDVDYIGIDETDVDPQLLSVILDLANNGIEVIITSLTTGKHSPESMHYVGNGIDIGFEDIEGYQKAFAHLYFNRETYKLNELIWGGALPAGTSTLKRGIPTQYLQPTLEAHTGHAHVSTMLKPSK